jgi:Reverse transcriptase (RNA-dependent DNA polymerase)
MLRPNVVQVIVHDFTTGSILESWRLSNLVLISKVERPLRSTHFRSLSVCSMYYRLFTKLIANRIKQVIANLVPQNKATFLKGWNIQNNVFLMKEVMHSFQDNRYKGKTFALNVDLYKAFNYLSWSYLEVLLQQYGFPVQLRNVLMTCVTSYKFNIKLNGSNSGGFITLK